MPRNHGIFAKIGRLASDEVMVQLLKQKCLPILLFALDVGLWQLGQMGKLLQNVDLFINPKKSVCMRIGPRIVML